MNDRTMQDSDQNYAAAHDLNWQAFRYIAGEMSDDERLAFETKLADDQAAREAVAAAVELTEVLLVTKGDVETIPAAHANVALSAVELPARGAWLKPAAWMSAGAAACLVAVLISQVWDQRTAQVAQSPSKFAGATLPATGRGESLALVWSQTRQSEPAVAVEDETASGDNESPMTSPLDHGEGSPVVTASGKTPSWIVAAVSGLANSQSPSKSANDKEDDDVEEL